MSHLTHSVIAPTSVGIIDAVDGRIVVVRIENERSQALVKFLV